MKTLSINFGHDASVCIFQNGRLIDFVEIERESRLKHHFGIDSSILDAYLARLGVDFKEVDIVCLSGTQQWGMYHDNRVRISFEYDESRHHIAGLKDYAHWGSENYDFHDGYAKSVYRDHVEKKGLTGSPSPVRSKWAHAFAKDFTNRPASLAAITRGVINLEETEKRRYWSYFIAPFVFSFDGIQKTAFYVDHHFSHANYALFYSSEQCLAVTHDGGVDAAPFNSGGLYFLEPNLGVLPIFSHGLTLGHLYDAVGSVFKLDAGKLMGLASYGRPNRFINSVIEKYKDNLYYGTSLPTSSLVQLILGASSMQFSLRRSGLDKFSFDFSDLQLAVQAAANTQHFVQTVYVEMISGACEDVIGAVPGIDTVYTTGGFSLNCPTNSELNFSNNTMRFRPLPGVGDTGLAIGSAVAVQKFLRQDLDLSHNEDKMAAAFPPSCLDSNSTGGGAINLTEIQVENLEEFVAEKLEHGSIICLHRGRSEVGPRALGNRSIIAWAGKEQVRDIINAKKGRESWRPLAPIIRSEDFHDYFCGDPDDCRFMLSVCKVKSGAISAVTHVDNTARVQVLDHNDVFLQKVLGGLKSRGLAPVIVNTSFNCAGEPLVETLLDAASSFRKMGFDYLISDRRVFASSAGK